MHPIPIISCQLSLLGIQDHLNPQTTQHRFGVVTPTHSHRITISTSTGGGRRLSWPQNYIIIISEGNTHTNNAFNEPTIKTTQLTTPEHPRSHNLCLDRRHPFA
jgi:hypothetical protein